MPLTPPPEDARQFAYRTARKVWTAPQLRDHKAEVAPKIDIVEPEKQPGAEV